MYPSGRAAGEVGHQTYRRPLATGRAERLFGTLQDRLVEELRWASTTTLAEANAALAAYLPRFNERVMKEAAEPGSACHLRLTRAEANDRTYCTYVARWRTTTRFRFLDRPLPCCRCRHRLLRRATPPHGRSAGGHLSRAAGSTRPSASGDFFASGPAPDGSRLASPARRIWRASAGHKRSRQEGVLSPSQSAIRPSIAARLESKIDNFETTTARVTFYFSLIGVIVADEQHSPWRTCTRGFHMMPPIP